MVSPSAAGELYLNDLSQPSILTYRHHTIPSGSKLTPLSAQTDHFPNEFITFLCHDTQQ